MQSALRTWVLVAVMNIAMIAVHTPFASGHQHGGGAAVAAVPMHHSTVMTLATALAAVEAVIATAVVYQRSRHNRAEIGRSGLLDGGRYFQVIARRNLVTTASAAK